MVRARVVSTSGTSRWLLRGRRRRRRRRRLFLFVLIGRIDPVERPVPYHAGLSLEVGKDVVLALHTRHVVVVGKEGGLDPDPRAGHCRQELYRSLGLGIAQV